MRNNTRLLLSRMRYLCIYQRPTQKKCAIKIAFLDIQSDISATYSEFDGTVLPEFRDDFPFTFFRYIPFDSIHSFIGPTDWKKKYTYSLTHSLKLTLTQIAYFASIHFIFDHRLIPFSIKSDTHFHLHIDLDFCINKSNKTNEHESNNNNNNIRMKEARKNDVWFLSHYYYFIILT